MRFLLMSIMTLLVLVDASRERWSRDEMVEMAGYGEHKLSSVFLTASVLSSSSSSSSSPVLGAIVGIKCHTGYRRRSKWIKAVTNELGQFVIDLPSHLHAIPDMDKACSVKLFSVPKPYHLSSKTHKGIKLLSSSESSRVYTTGNITLQLPRSTM